jgi:Bacterial SH3 domain
MRSVCLGRSRRRSGGVAAKWGRSPRQPNDAALSYLFFSTKTIVRRAALGLTIGVPEDAQALCMFEAFVIAFIHCGGQACTISYPRPDLAFSSYGECAAQLPHVIQAGRGLGGGGFAPSDLRCLEVSGRYIADEWIALQTTNLRQSPDPGASVVATVKRGTHFRVFALERKWLCVETADGTIGFLWSDRATRLHSGPMTPEMRDVRICEVPENKPGGTEAEAAEAQNSSDEPPVARQKHAADSRN